MLCGFQSSFPKNRSADHALASLLRLPGENRMSASLLHRAISVLSMRIRG